MVQDQPFSRRLFALIAVFGKFGAITFGGGYAVLAMIEHELVERRRWMSHEELLNLVTISETTPGPIAVNLATFVGYRMAGFWGGCVATFSLVFPAWLIIFCLSSCYLLFRETPWVASLLAGIRIAAIVLVLRAFLKMGKKLSWGWVNALIAGIAFLSVVLFSISAIVVLLLAILFGVYWHGVRQQHRQVIEETSP